MNRGLIAAILLSATMAQAGEPTKVRSLDQLLADRAEVTKVLDGLRQSFDKIVADFQKRPETVKFNEDQAKTRQAYQDVDKRLKELDGLIAEQVAKERK